ncbi:MAG: xanthine dehydrogenase small subunit [Snowella sp.]|nr:MAG: xanthine dehydrogenase small subunit [Snowella sp.]
MISTANGSLEIQLNGKKLRINDSPPTTTLLEYLRQHGYVGTKEGCGDGDCGACTVVVVGQGADGKAHYQAMNSCLIPLGSLADREVITVEGIANGKLHPVQSAMIATGGSQCGYCTPGFIMSMFAGYYDGKVDDISIEGNLCRCTGYLPIREAAQRVTNAKADDDFSQKLAIAAPELLAFSYQDDNYQFYRPTSLNEVLSLLQDHSDATFIAGGTDLGLELSHHRREFPVLISLEAVHELKIFNITDEWLEIGAGVPLSQIEERSRGIFPSMDEMIHWFAARQIRNRATLGGNIAVGSPIGDLPPVLLSLDAQLKIAGQNGTRMIALADFFHGYRQTDLQKGEVIVSVHIPRTLPSGTVTRLSQSYKIGKRGTDDISIVAAAFCIDLDSAKKVVQARLAYGGVAAIPIRAKNVEEMLVGQPWNTVVIQQAKAALKETFTPLSDFRGSAEYRKSLIANLFEKFFVEFGGIETYPLEVK